MSLSTERQFAGLETLPYPSSAESTATVIRLPEPRTPSDEYWDAAAPCREIGTDMFYPEKSEAARDPKSICQGCNFVAKCLTDAFNNNEMYGVWGGLSERERRLVRKSATSPDNLQLKIGLIAAEVTTSRTPIRVGTLQALLAMVDAKRGHESAESNSMPSFS